MRGLLVCAALLAALPSLAQDKKPPESQDVMDVPRFPQKQYFRELWTPPIPRVELKTPAKFRDYVVSDRLELSLKAYIDLVLANNTDIELQRLTVEQPRNAITRSYGLFDPSFLGRFAATRSTTAATDQLQGASTLSALSQPWTFQVGQLLPWGTQYTFGFNGAKASSNSTFNTFNPSYSTNLAFSFSQPLMRGRGRDITRLNISIARSRFRQSEYTSANQILGTLLNAELAYWTVLENREQVLVQEKALQLADQFLKRSQRELELGAISPLDIYQPQQNYANAEITLTQARYRLAQAEDQLRRQMAADLDQDIRKLPIVLTEGVTGPTDNGDFDKEAIVTKAIAIRPDLRGARQALDIDDLNIKGARNSLMPNLALGGAYTSQGRGGTFFPRQSLGAETPILPIPGGIGDAFDQLFGFGFPVYNFSLTLNLPLRNRAAHADLADAQVQRKRDMLTIRNTEQQVRLEVLNAINQVENSRASAKLAQIARDFSQKRVDAEQKKYELGTTTIFLVLAAQQDLTRDEANLVQQNVGYRRALVQLQQRTGELLSERGVVVP